MTLFDKFLTKSGHEVIAKAFNGEEAIESFKTLKEKPDIFLIDHHTPKKDGLVTIKEIMTLDPTSKIVFCSADPNMKQKVYELGAWYFLEKPVDFRTFIQIIEQL